VLEVDMAVSPLELPPELPDAEVGLAHLVSWNSTTARVLSFGFQPRKSCFTAS
jgi:hypothetical protein